MATTGETSSRKRARARTAPTWADLERGLAATLPALGDGYLILATRVGNRFVQFAANPEKGMRAEAVSGAYLPPGDGYTEAQVAALLELGWKAPTHAPEDEHRKHRKHGSPNYYRNWDAPVTGWDAIARLAVKTLQTIGVSEPDALEYTAWDAEERPLSLPALRLAAHARPARKRKSPAATETPKPAAKPAPKARKVRPAIREARKKLLDAVRVFSANSALDYDDDGDIPMRFGASLGWARFIENPALVNLHFIIAHDVDVTEALLRRVHEINAGWFLARLVVSGRNVFAAADFVAEPFCVEHFTGCCAALLAMEREHGEELRGKAAAARKQMD